jgi:hypothetical protein
VAGHGSGTGWFLPCCHRHAAGRVAAIRLMGRLRPLWRLPAAGGDGRRDGQP